MAKNKEQKKEILAGLKKRIGDSKSIIFTSFDALGVKESGELRQSLKNENSEYLVTKKTLLDLALKDEKIEGLDVRSFEGKVAAVFGYEDEITPAKVVDKFMEENKDKIEFIGGILDNKFMSKLEIEQLAKLPSKQELYAKIVGSLNAPISGFVNVLAGNIRGLVNVLKAIEEKKA